jgi:hypothetical protein
MIAPHLRSLLMGKFTLTPKPSFQSDLRRNIYLIGNLQHLDKYRFTQITVIDFQGMHDGK